MDSHVSVLMVGKSFHQASLDLKALQRSAPTNDTGPELQSASEWHLVCMCDREQERQRERTQERPCVLPSASAFEQSPPSTSQAHHHLSPSLPPLSHLRQWGTPPPPKLGEPDGRNQGLICPREAVLGLLPLPQAPSHLGHRAGHHPHPWRLLAVLTPVPGPHSHWPLAVAP